MLKPFKEIPQIAISYKFVLYKTAHINDTGGFQIVMHAMAASFLWSCNFSETINYYFSSRDWDIYRKKHFETHLKQRQE